MNDSSNDELRQRLIKDFSDREIRQGYAEGFQHTWIASQLTRVRQQRGLTQRELAELVGTQQPGIARMEREDYGKWNIATLSRIAAALDCWLMVSLESYGTLIEKAARFTSPEFLDRPEFATDPVVHPVYKDWPSLGDPGPTGEMSRKLQRWFDSRNHQAELKGWLLGQGLPPVGDDIAPSEWLAEGLRGCPAEQASIAANRIAKFIEEGAAAGFLYSEPFGLGVQLFGLVAAWPNPLKFWDPLGFAWERAKKPVPDSLRNPLRRNLVEALKMNQDNDSFEEIWEGFVECGWRADSDKDLALQSGFEGLIMIPSAPNVHKLIHGCELTPIGKRQADALSNAKKLVEILKKTEGLISDDKIGPFRERVWPEARNAKLRDYSLGAVLAAFPMVDNDSEEMAVRKFFLRRPSLLAVAA